MSTLDDIIAEMGDDPRALFAVIRVIEDLGRQLGEDKATWEGARAICEIITDMFRDAFGDKIGSGSRSIPMSRVEAFGTVLMVLEAALEPKDET